ncbi:M48 family metallopeptidase [Spiribacter roseus]|uniref:M48 family metallopeptidase n=1 Tax=Spiribacter roseus TaxID=1855875 RepID=UPI00132FE253|nr:M48 family metallopeptidase [Spiribacter roseus]KAF0281937.1 peptidase [Spiribacter roseus]
MIASGSRALAALVLVALLSACATSPTGRPQLQFMPDAQIRSMGVEAYREMQDAEPVLEAGPRVARVECVAEAIIPQVPDEYAGNGWEVTVFESDQVNAFALPGGKIGVYTGLLEVTENPDQLAAVIAHEIAHVMAEHANERMSTEMATALGLGALQVAAGDDPQRRRLMAVLGVGAQVGIILPFSRTHESEADEIGLGLMADAGFDPRASVALWRNMADAGGEAPPEFLSTHPSGETRIADLRAELPTAIYRYEQARAGGRRPDCAS